MTAVYPLDERLVVCRVGGSREMVLVRRPLGLTVRIDHVITIINNIRSRTFVGI